MDWRNHITQTIKLVIWDLDDTIWAGTLAENDEVRLYSYVRTTLEKLTKSGIINTICSKNHMVTAKKKLLEYGLWEFFILPSVDYMPKGPRVKKLLHDLQLRAENTLLIDDSASELSEVKYYNKDINLLHSSLVDGLLENPFLQGSPDEALIRFNQYKQMEKMVETKKHFGSNEEFLRAIKIRIAFVDYEPEYLERIAELVNRTNQLNYTKNRMNREEIKKMLSDDNIVAKCIQVIDDFGDKGFVGFYAMKEQTLIHFLFSCRIMNMGIEQWVYSYLNYPDLTVVGQVAMPLTRQISCNDYIQLINQNNVSYNDCSLSTLTKKHIDDSQLTNIYALGSCDMFTMIGNFAAPCNRIVIESNTLKGNYRGVNAGTEYIRSSFDMNSEEKEFCKTHFYNYMSESVFQPKIFQQKYDYVILSFQDEFLYRIWENKNDSNLRIIRDNEPIIDKDFSILNREESEAWLKKHFQEPYFMDETMLYKNLQWIRDKLDPETVLILLNGPEYNFYMLTNNRADRRNPELHNRIIQLNKTIEQFTYNNEQNVRLIDVNRFLTKISDFTNHIFHWAPIKSFEIARECLKTMSRDDVRRNHDFLRNLPINDRKIVIWGVNMYAQICLLSLLANGTRIYTMCHHTTFTSDDFDVKDAEILKGNKQQYYVIVIDEDNCEEIETLLSLYGYAGYEDYIRLNTSILLKNQATVT